MNILPRTTSLASLLAALALLSACSSVTREIRQEPTITSAGILAFRDICLKSAPSFAGAETAARSHGILELTDAGFAKMGMNEDQTLGVQVQAGKECAITTPSQNDSSLTQQFLSMAGKFSSTPLAQSVPTKITLDGQTFILMHDRRGGEAYVLLKAP
ncbi:hypothetical protein DNK59_10830 [Pseudomonas sp. TKO26]|uniref:Lipoprotein n=1 Tax=Pseudomonas saponiphila TaxID=556534 RepID=A0A1H4MH41_9PSED|nr:MULTISPECIES: hypothetical protein [Pseudomonas]PYY87025.1 hypothetical protein DNK62_10830 [Pseudomonas sp. TKO30]PYY89889.1 hypothetical protein DNK61_10825 [Pseudomonas sp. TKO29]PYY92976.1 hypothetical protein DNK59_10830 [Pseudomonas sp. TKO26]PYZ00106.1 hypothetical protein DNK60_10825 [Pseudomonas sp. TKO14]SEB82028.1 hypothetical protein SAMN05216178_2383 [Pseudomonas saponiphila]